MAKLFDFILYTSRKQNFAKGGFRHTTDMNVYKYKQSAANPFESFELPDNGRTQAYNFNFLDIGARELIICTMSLKPFNSPSIPNLFLFFKVINAVNPPFTEATSIDSISANKYSFEEKPLTIILSVLMTTEYRS